MFKPGDATQKKELPFYTDRISAGFPSPAEDHIEKKLDLNELVIKHPSASYFVKVTGDSMKNSGINDGDVLVVDKSLSAVDNDIVIAVLNGELTVKRVKRSRKDLFLVPENPEFEPIKITPEMDLIVWGVVTAVIHRLK
ncbi:MAG: translesion error-prone DNA polymerase V autoproteolytic subunit [Candidatus Omnitrophica bacterium]|nr:translesion error-prone DNA polymerase V autoproteolytic subunit [Candidatus Omnitrophota bacterium]